MQKLSVIRMIILCSSIALLGTGCTNFPFLTNTDTGNENTMDEEWQYSWPKPVRPTEPQDTSLIITGKYSGIAEEGAQCSVAIKKNNNKEFPFKIYTNYINEKNSEWEENCYQNKNTLICLSEHTPEFYFTVTQNNDKEIEITQFGYRLAHSGSSVGECSLCTGTFTKK